MTRLKFYNMWVDFRLPNLEKYETGQKVLTLASQHVDPSITWDTVTWLKSITNLPIVVKGILTGHLCSIYLAVFTVLYMRRFITIDDNN